MFSPLRRMTFFQRSTKYRFSSASRRTTSPVWNQPPSHAASVACTVTEVFGEEPGTRIGFGGAYQQFARRIVGDVCAGVVDDAIPHERTVRARSMTGRYGAVRGWRSPRRRRRFRSSPRHRSSECRSGPRTRRGSADRRRVRNRTAHDAPGRPGDGSKPSSIVGITPRLCRIVALVSRTSATSSADGTGRAG